MEHTGMVTEFDDSVGLGVITSGGETYPFHCTVLIDGTRHVAVGTAVRFVVAPGHHGRWEARHVVNEPGVNEPGVNEPDVTRSGATQESARFACPVCGLALAGAPRTYEICGRCGWEDDPVQFRDPAYTGGANAQSLDAARQAWVAAPTRQ